MNLSWKTHDQIWYHASQVQKLTPFLGSVCPISCHGFDWLKTFAKVSKHLSVFFAWRLRIVIIGFWFPEAFPKIVDITIFGNCYLNLTFVNLLFLIFVNPHTIVHMELNFIDFLRKFFARWASSQPKVNQAGSIIVNYTLKMLLLSFINRWRELLVDRVAF